MFRNICLLMALLGLLNACANVRVNDYRNNEPSLVLEQFFNGQLTAHGVIKNRGGKVTRYFNATIDAHWDQGVGTLAEYFWFNDGEEQSRQWTLMPTGNGRYIATAGDVIGEGDANLAGNSLFLDYVLRVPYNDGTVDVRIDDRMYLVNPHTLINESGMYKFGFKVGSIALVIIKH